MREFLENIRFHIVETWYNLKSKISFISERTMYKALSFLVVSWSIACVYLFATSFWYESDLDKYKKDIEPIDITTRTLERAETLSGIGSKSEAFTLLVTHLNHFSYNDTEKQKDKIKKALDKLIADVPTGDIESLYRSKDLIEVQPIQRFVGIVNSIDDDELYGETYTISTTGERQQEQLEVAGLKDIILGTQVEFYGVPTFDTVSAPIKIEAYVPEIIEEDGVEDED